MASSDPSTTFRFLDLPREIRNKIYRAALCTFELQPTTFVAPLDADTKEDLMREVALVKHSIDASILLASKQVHREAYETMIKTNRFVRVTTSWGLPLRPLLNFLRVPVVTENKESVDQFKGYVLSVSVTCSREVGSTLKVAPPLLEPCSFMLLSRDMGAFCDILMDGDVYLAGFGSKVSLKIAVAPGSVLTPSPYKDSVTDFFSETTQQTILQPFRNRLRGFTKVKVRGLVSRSIAEAAEHDMGRDAASDPDAILSQFQKKKDIGQSLYEGKDFEAAWLEWQDAALEIEKLHHNMSWNVLVGKGGVDFVSRIAEIYFLMRLNVVHIKIAAMQKGEQFANILAEDSLRQAKISIGKDYWMPDFRWRPTAMHRAKFLYRWALFRRLERIPATVDDAVAAIEAANRLLPGNAGIAKERDTILAWKEEIRQRPRQV